MSATDRAMLNEHDAAKQLGVTVATMRRWRGKSEGPKYIKFGTHQQARIRYQLSDIEAYKAECSVDPKEAKQ